MLRPPRILLLLTNLWLIVSAALFTRVAFACYQQRQIPHQVLATVPFEQEAGNIAIALSQHQGFSNLFRQNTGPTAWLAPVYPFLLSRIFAVTGPSTLSSFFLAVAFNILCSAFVIFPLFHVAEEVAGKTVAAFTAWLWVFFPAGIIMPFEWIWDTSLSVLLAISLLWLTLRLSRSRHPVLWLAYALLWSFALLTNPALFVALPFYFIWAAVRSRKLFQATFLLPALSFFLIIFCCLPWTVRNYARFHRFIPIRSSLPFELWSGNNDIFDPHASNAPQRITRFQEIRSYSQLGETAYLDQKRAAAFTFIRTKPSLFLRLTVFRFIATWLGTQHPLADFLRADSLLVRVIFLCNAILALGASAGALILARTRHPLAFPIIVFPVFYPLVYYFTHASLRYRHPIDPVLLLLTTVAAAALLATFRRSASKPASSPASGPSR